MATLQGTGSEQPVDFHRIKTVTGGDRTLAQSIFDVFVQDSEMRLQGIESALKDLDGGMLKHHAHALKGSASNIGAGALAEYAYALEQLGAQDACAEARPVADDLCAEYGRVVEALKDYSGDEGVSPG